MNALQKRTGRGFPRLNFAIKRLEHWTWLFLSNERISVKLPITDEDIDQLFDEPESFALAVEQRIGFLRKSIDKKHSGRRKK
jgi:hypothetical protein